MGPYLLQKRDLNYGRPCFEGGLYWCYNGYVRIPNQGPILLPKWAYDPVHILARLSKASKEDYKKIYKPSYHM